MKNVEDVYPLSPMQQGLLFHTLYAPKSGVYFEQLISTLYGDLNVSAFKQAWQRVVELHSILRTAFIWDGLDEPLQVVRRSVNLPWINYDWRSLSVTEQQEQLEAFLQADRDQGFKLDKAPLMRCVLMQVAENTYQFVWSFHHLLIDGWCVPILLKEVLAFYEALKSGDNLSLPAPRPYRDYIGWLQQQDHSQAEAFWRQALKGFTAPTPVMVDRSFTHHSHQKQTYDQQHLQLSATLTTALQSFARQHYLTLNNLIQGAWALLLGHYSGEPEVVFGVTMSGRPPSLVGVESMVGLFINTLPIRVPVSEEVELLTWLKDLQAQLVECEQYSYSPLVDIQGWSEVPRGMPLFDSILVFQNYPVDESLQQHNGSIEISHVHAIEQTNYPLTVVAIPSSQLFVKISYDTSRFDDATILRILGHFQVLLEGMVATPQQCLSKFHLPDKLAQKKAENIQLENNFNDKKLHHLGFACRNIQEGIAHIRTHYRVTKISDIIFDELQNASVCLIETENGIALELVSGHQVESLLNRGVNLYHVCYEVSDLFLAIEEFKSQGASLVSQPKPAKLFNNRLVAFLNTTLGLVELLEKTKSEFSEQLIQEFYSSNTQAQKQTIAITATFTSDMIEEFLVFWMQELGIPSQIEFASYNQVFQQLLNPSSQLSQNKNGINVVLVRFEDWQKYEDNSLAVAESTENIYENIQRNVQDLVLALKSSAQRSATPHLVCLCPASPQFLEESNRIAFLKRMEQQIVSELVNFSNIHLVTSSELTAIYPVSDYYDPHGSELGHIPYTPTFFSALGTMIARKIFKINSTPYKVIVLDCDQTLWQGVCGEDGALGVEIDPPRQAFQEFIVAQEQVGKLICLCSKNDESDVWAVFEHHQSMPLKRDHLVSWRINWKSKSENIQSLANELQLGLDSFIFIDDNPVECAEVQANCPEVLTIQLPQQSSRIPEFLKHIWAFDNLKVTKEDLARTELYRQNVQRECWREESLTFADFLAGLRLQVEVNAIAPHQLNRVSQLTQRTNQLNFTTIRRSEGEIQQLCKSGKLECLTVEVKDRFGDYGLVGTIMFESGVDAITVDTFLLSCRVLGRGVEYKMLAQLGDIARERRLRRVDVFYVPTQKNQSAFDFLDSIGVEFKQKVDRGWLFRFPVELITQLTFRSSIGEAIPASDLPAQKSTVAFATQLSAKSALYQRIATELYDAAQVLNLVKSQKHQERPELKQGFVEPRSSVEELVAGIWRDILNLAQVGIHDNFFELGGHSLLATQVISRFQEAFCVKLPLLSLFQKPTVAGIAEYIERIHWTAQLQTSTSTTLNEREEIEL